MTYDEQSQSDTNPDDEQSQSDTDSVNSSVAQLEDEHSLMDYHCTPMPTFSSPCNMEDTVSTSPIPCPRCSKTHPTPLPRALKVINNSRLKPDTNNTKPARRNCQKEVQKEVPSCTWPEPTRKTPLLPTPPTPV